MRARKSKLKIAQMFLIAFAVSLIVFSFALLHETQMNEPSGEGISYELAWARNGIQISATNNGRRYMMVDSIPDGLGGAIAVWWVYDGDILSEGNIYAQKININGYIQWSPGGIPVCDINSARVRGNYFGQVLISDGDGGFIAVWDDKRNGNYDIYAQRIDRNGIARWAANGISVYAAQGDQKCPLVVTDGYGGAIITWDDSRNSNEGVYEKNIYAQRINADGIMQWGENGIKVCVERGHQSYPYIIEDGNHGAIIAWADGRNGNVDIYVQKINERGELEWAPSGEVVCNAPNNQLWCPMVSDGRGGAFIAWWDERNGPGGHRPWRELNADIYAQKIESNGTMLWQENGVPICTNIAPQEYPEIISDYAGGAIIAWKDYRNGIGRDVNFDIYMQKIDSNGNTVWGNDGISVCTAPDDQNHLSIISDNNGGAIIAWDDDRDNNFDIYAQKINTNGAPQWEDNGKVICNAADEQYSPFVIDDGRGGVIIFWADKRNENYDIYAQRVEAVVRNNQPILAPVDNKITDEGRILTFTVTAADQDGDRLIYTAGNLPAGANFDSFTQIFTWTPQYTQAGIYNVSFTVSDGSLTDSKTIQITVNNVNRPPVLIPVGDKITRIGQRVGFVVTAADPDGDRIRYSVSGLPRGAVFTRTSNGKRFTWNRPLRARRYSVTFRAIDEEGLAGVMTVNITVLPRQAQK